MSQNEIFLPVLVLVAHTFIVWCWMYIVRLRGIKTGIVTMQTFRDRQTSTVTKGANSTASDNLINLFELPVLFYVVVLLLFQLQAVSTGYIWLAWAFVLSRIAHSVIHIGYNNVLHRFVAYFLGSCVLWMLWAGMAIHLLSSWAK